MNMLFSINGKSYKAKEFTYNLVCDLEEMGVSITDAGTKPMSMLRAYFALCTERDREYAGKEMEAHLLGGGTFNDISDAMAKMMAESDFFRSLSQNQTETTGATPKKTTKKATAEA